MKLRNFIFLKIAHLKYDSNWISEIWSSRPVIPPSLKRLVKAVGLRSAKTHCGATIAKGFWHNIDKERKMRVKLYVAAPQRVFTDLNPTALTKRLSEGVSGSR